MLYLCDKFNQTYQELYEMRVKELGAEEEDERTILAGDNYAIALLKVDCGEEAMELLNKLLAMSKQVLGSHHNTTKELQSATLDVARKNPTSANSQDRYHLLFCICTVPYRQ